MAWTDRLDALSEYIRATRVAPTPEERAACLRMQEAAARADILTREQLQEIGERSRRCDASRPGESFDQWRKRIGRRIDGGRRMREAAPSWAKPLA